MKIKEIGKRIHFLIFIISALVGLIMVSCAKQGYPTGGPKDTTAPVAAQAQPPSGTTNFATRDIYIPFDEYVVMKDADNNVLISPPMKKKPEYVPKGKGLLVRIKDTLLENTTYLMQFKGAIADLNEGNVLDSYEYAFSTGTVIDSMSYSGAVVDALTQKPSENTVTVALYSPDADDSTAAKQTPLYVTRCSKQGDFKFSHIKPGNYRILAFEDENNDMKLTAGEAVAFCDTLIASRTNKPAMSDTVNADTLTDPISKLKTNKPVLSKTDNLLRLSASKQEAQRILSSKFLSKGRIQIIMQAPLKDYQLESTDNQKLVKRLGRNADTLDIWTARADCDSIVLVMSHNETNDTLRLKYRDKRKPKPASTPTKTILVVRSRIAPKTPFFDTLRFDFGTPVKHTAPITDSIVTIKNLTDSTTVRVPLQLDSLGLSAIVYHSIQPGAKYEIQIREHALTDIYGNSCDSVKVATEITTADQYGMLKLSINPKDCIASSDGQYLIQVLDEKMNLVKEQAIEGARQIVFENMDAAKYTIRAIIDDNRNGQWDAGNYWTHQQPERVVYFTKTLELRENWEMEEKFEF